MGLFEKDIKKLGFGLMRLPKKNGEIEIGQVKTMVDLFMDAGFTYFDTAFVYQGSEEAIKKALVERYPRDSYQLATKNAVWAGSKTKEDALKQFETSLERTGAGYFDNYLLHNLGGPRTAAFEELEMWDLVREKKEEGKIRHYGFSFHSTADELDEILTAHPDAEFVQLQINYADWDNPSIQSRAIYETALKHEKPIVVMEPLKGGLLATPPDAVADILKARDPEMSMASWGIRFAAGLPGVLCVLSGMSSIEQMQDNISYMKDFDGLNADESLCMDKAREALSKIPLIPCTSCDYCAKVCPMDIGISGSFDSLNMYTLYGNLEEALHSQDFTIKAKGRKFASECIQCGQCEDVCPQKINIRDELVKVSETFGR